MATSEDRRRMATAILSFEARRDKDGNLAVYKLPRSDGGGKYEVAGINERYNKETADVLVGLINAHRYEEAENLAIEFIAQDTDRATSWTKIPAIEFYLRDCVFNRGPRGAAKILQDAVGTHIDGVVGRVTLEAVRTSEATPILFLQKLRTAREAYERNVAKRNENSKFWKGLVNRWNNALTMARTFSLGVEIVAFTVSNALQPFSLPTSRDIPSVLSALRVGSTGPRVSAWQAFLVGAGHELHSIDGYFGEATRNATAQFQKAHKLTVDGIAGRETLLKAAELGFELFEEPADDKTSSNFPPPPSFTGLSEVQRASIFGSYDYVPAPTRDNPEAIRILGNWVSQNIKDVPIPQLRKRLGRRAPETMQFHKLGAEQLRSLWAKWESEKLLDHVRTFNGAFVPRFIRGSRTRLSNHAFGTAFDINYQWNKLGERPALVGQEGSVRELVEIANDHGLFWGGHFERRKDGMHFEIAFLL